MVAVKKFHISVIAVLVLFFLFTYILPLGNRPMVRPDEFRYGEIPREMLETGDWITPRLAGIRYFEKPALGYQMTALSFQYLGENTFALRLPSALAVALAAAFLYYLVWRKTDDPWTPGLATLVYLTSGLVYGVGTFAVLDSQLASALTLTIGAFYLAWDTADIRKRFLWLVFAGIAAGTAFLLKGFLAFVIPSIVAIPFLLWQKDWKRIFTMPWFPFAAAVLVILPWSLSILKVEPDFWRYFIVEEHWNRFLGETYDRGPEPFWYFIPVLVGGILPAGLLCSAAWIGWTKEFFQKPFHRFLICWFAIPFLFFSISSCKLGTYILPCFPPLAVLIALGIRDALLRKKELSEKILGQTLFYFGLLLMIAGIAGVIVLLIWPLIPKLPVLYPKWSVFPYITLMIAAVWGFLLIREFRRRSPGMRMIAFLLLGLAPLIFVGLHSFPNEPFGDKMASIGIQACLQKMPVSKETVILTDRSIIAAVAWNLRRTDLILAGKPGELRYGLANYPEYEGRLYTKEEAAGFLNRNRNREIIYISARNLKKPLPDGWPQPETVSACEIVFDRFPPQENAPE